MPYYEGDTSASITLIGEAPGEQEVKYQRPFIGQAGHLLDKCLMSAGLLRQQLYITNVVKERPPNNDISVFIKFDRHGQAQPTPAYTRYENMLAEELAHTESNLFVALGNVALYALTRKTGISKRRGSLYPCTLVPDRKVSACIHPSAALHVPNYERLIIFDLARAREESAFRDLRYQERSLILRPSFIQAMDYIESARHCASIAFDIEIVGEGISCFSIAKSLSDIICIPFHDEHGDYFTPPQEAEIWKATQKLLEDPNVVKVGQNLIFDATFLLHTLGILIQPIEDTMIAQAIIHTDAPRGLDFITSIYTREPYYKDEGKKWMKVAGSFESFWTYNCKDSAVCAEVFPKMQQDLIAQGNASTYNHQRDLIYPLMYMQERGMRLDIVAMRKRSEQLTTEIAELEVKFNELAPGVNPASPKQLQDLFYTQLKIKPYTKVSKNKDGQRKSSITTDEMALKRIARKGYKEAQLILDIRRRSKLKSTYIDIKLDADNRIRGALNPVGTKYGRLSSSTNIFGIGVNMQTLPPELKRLCIADELCVLANIDLAQAENRCVAYFANEVRMMAAFEAGKDIHKQTAGLIFGIDPEEVSSEPGSSFLGGGRFSQRDWGKRANHALNYNLTYRQFALMWEIEERDAKAMIERYFQVYPGVRNWHAATAKEYRDNGFVENPFGRKATFAGAWEDIKKEAYAFKPQSTVADKMNRDGVCEAYYNPYYSYIECLNTVHDSIVLQSRADTTQACEHLATRLVALIKNLEQPITYQGRSFVIPADLSIGMNLAKYKPEKNEPGLRETNNDKASPERLAQRIYDLYQQLRAT